MTRKLAPGKKVGDVFEISTSQGYGYIQVIARSLLGELVRVFQRLYHAPTKELDDVVSGEFYFVYFLASFAAKRSMIKYVGHVPCQTWEECLPLLRSPGAISKDGKTLNWVLPDGNGTKIVQKLTPEQREMSIQVAWNHEYLVKRLEQGYHPRDWA